MFGETMRFLINEYGADTDLCFDYSNYHTEDYAVELLVNYADDIIDRLISGKEKIEELQNKLALCCAGCEAY